MLYGDMRITEKLAKLIDNQSRVSRMTGLSQSAISEATAGKRRLYLDQAFLIARALGVSLDWLADDEKGEQPTPLELPEDERSILKLYRALRLTEDEGLRRLAGEPITETAVGGTARTIAERDTSEAARRDEKRRLGFELDPDAEGPGLNDIPPFRSKR